MIKINDKVKLKPEVYDSQDGLVEWIKYYMGENIDYYNIIWTVNEKAIAGCYTLRDMERGLNASSFSPKEMIKIDNPLKRLKKRYQKLSK